MYRTLLFISLLTFEIEAFPNLTHCNNQEISSTSGFIARPNYSREYSGEYVSNCSIRTPSDLVMTLRLVDGNINDSGSSCACCSFLEVSTKGKPLRKFCRGDAAKPLLVKANSIDVMFRSDSKGNLSDFLLHYVSRDGSLCFAHELSCLSGKSCFNITQLCDEKFDCSDHSDELNCGVCTKNYVPCNFNTVRCFNPFTERCDGIMNCPAGEDEVSCSSSCNDKIACGDGNGCFTTEQVCDDVRDCEDGTDESNCTFRFCDLYPNRPNFICDNKLCISSKLVGNGEDDCGDASDERMLLNTSRTVLVWLVAAIVFLVFFKLSLICTWKRNRRDIRNLMANMPDFPLPPFHGPGETDRILFEGSESLPQSEEMFEAYRYARNETLSDRRRHSSRTVRVRSARTNSSLMKCNTNCTAVTLASLGLSPNDCLDLDHDCGEHFSNHFENSCESPELIECQPSTSKMSSLWSGSSRKSRTAKVSCYGDGDFEDPNVSQKGNEPSDVSKVTNVKPRDVFLHLENT